MNSRKQIVAKIRAMDNLLKYEKTEVAKHHKYLSDTINDHRLIVITTLLPAILWGWKLGKEKKVSTIIKKIVEFGLVNAFTYVRKQFVVHHK